MTSVPPPSSPPGLVHLPIALVLSACVAIVSFSLWIGGLQAEVKSLQAWRVQVEKTSFTKADARLLESLIKSEVREERVFSRQLCNDLARLYRELDFVPPNDCNRP